VTPGTGCLAYCPISRLCHGSPDVGGSFRRARISGEVIVFKGTFDPVLGHAISNRSDTEGDICRRRTVLVLGGGTETFEAGLLDLGPLRGEREASCRRASRSCSRATYLCVISCLKASAMGYCSPSQPFRRTKGKNPSCLRYFGLQLVKPGSRPNRRQSAALGRAPYRAAKVWAAKVPRSLGKTVACLIQAWKLPALVSTMAQGSKPSAESRASEA